MNCCQLCINSFPFSFDGDGLITLVPDHFLFLFSTGNNVNKSKLNKQNVSPAASIIMFFVKPLFYPSEKATSAQRLPNVVKTSMTFNILG